MPQTEKEDRARMKNSVCEQYAAVYCHGTQSSQDLHISVTQKQYKQ